MDVSQGVYDQIVLFCTEVILYASQNTLLHPDERQLARGIKATDVPARLQAMVDALVWESTRTEEG